MTTPVPTPKLLKEYLDELDEITLKDFQWFLAQINIDGSRPIPRSKLEKATRVETVNKLVEAFGEDGAVQWTVDTFLRMKLNDLASKLVQAIGDQSMEQREDEPETSSAREERREVDPTILKDFSCSICLNLFTDPVVLQCGHSFCQSCVHKDWETNIVRECPLCKQFIPEGDPPINFSLKSLCENYRGRSQDEPSGGHRNHTETFQTPPENIREKQEALKEARQLCDSLIEHIKTQSCNIENKIMDDFKRRRAFLDKEEKTRLAALRQEARLEIRRIHLMHDRIKNKYSLSDTEAEISKLEAGKRFIEARGTQKIRMLRARRKLRIILKAQINASEHLRNLPLTVLETTGKKIKQTSAVVDPKTASSPLSVSDHPTNVNGTRQPCPGNLERSTSHQQNPKKSLKRRRVEQDSKNGKVSFHDPDNNTSILTHEQTFTQSPVDDFSDDILPISPVSSEELDYDDVDIMHVPQVGISCPPRHEMSPFLLDCVLQVLNGGSSAAQVTPGPVCSANKDLPHSADALSGD